ncbi:hypothetical protein ACVOMV_29035 [Mesorhizobium atlanticum]
MLLLTLSAKTKVVLGPVDISPQTLGWPRCLSLACLRPAPGEPSSQDAHGSTLARGGAF